MRTRIGIWFVIVGVVCGLIFAGYSQGASTSNSSSKKASVPAPKPTWVVIEVMNWKGDISYEAIQPQGIHNRITKLHQDYLKAVEKWKKDKILAEIKKETFDEKKPVLGYVKRVETNPPYFKYQDLASAEAAELTKKMKEGNAGK